MYGGYMCSRRVRIKAFVQVCNKVMVSKSLVIYSSNK